MIRCVRPLEAIADEFGLHPSEWTRFGREAAKVDVAVATRRRRGARLVLVTAITPTRAGEGKTTVAIGLADGLRRHGASACVALRQPSLGPFFGRKGGATGGGASRLHPALDINLHFTGDFHAIRDLMDDRPHRIRVRTDRPRELATEVMRSVGVQAVELEPEAPGRPGGFVVETTDAPRFRRAIATASQGVGASLLEVTPLDDDLDSVFRYLVGR